MGVPSSADTWSTEPGQDKHGHQDHSRVLLEYCSEGLHVSSPLSSGLITIGLITIRDSIELPGVASLLTPDPHGFPGDTSGHCQMFHDGLHEGILTSFSVLLLALRRGGGQVRGCLATPGRRERSPASWSETLLLAWAVSSHLWRPCHRRSRAPETGRVGLLVCSVPLWYNARVSRWRLPPHRLCPGM